MVCWFCAVHIPPELCRFHPLTQAAYVAARYVPHLVWWLSGLLRGVELRSRLKHPSLAQCRQALCSPLVVQPQTWSDGHEICQPDCTQYL